jgi:hypothetical protein
MALCEARLIMILEEKKSVYDGFACNLCTDKQIMSEK